jgi:UDP-2,3-diacylglucosamine hydrolase
LPSPCYIVSDHHFGANSEGEERNFVGFLRQLQNRAGSLLINGDLFDFWFEWRSVIPRAGFRVLAALADLREAGVPVVWIGGNHDCWGADTVSREIGVNYQLGAWHGNMAGWRAEVEHGDGLRPVGDRGYRALRAVIRHPAAIAAMRVLHPDIGSWIATRSSSTSRVHRDADGGGELRELAMGRLAKPNSPELYVLGHNHVPALERAPGGSVYANAGPWGSAGSHLVVTEQSIALQTFDPSTGENQLHILNRSA